MILPILPIFVTTTNAMRAETHYIIITNISTNCRFHIRVCIAVCYKSRHCLTSNVVIIIDCEEFELLGIGNGCD